MFKENSSVYLIKLFMKFSVIIIKFVKLRGTWVRVRVAKESGSGPPPRGTSHDTFTPWNKYDTTFISKHIHIGRKYTVSRTSWKKFIFRSSKGGFHSSSVTWRTILLACWPNRLFCTQREQFIFTSQENINAIFYIPKSNHFNVHYQEKVIKILKRKLRKRDEDTADRFHSFEDYSKSNYWSPFKRNTFMMFLQ